MSTRTAEQAFADAASALTGEYDVTDVLARLTRDCAEVVSAQAVGLLVLNGRRELELLSATSHRVADLELYQIQHDAGPCVDAVRSNDLVSARGAEAIGQRWGSVGPAVLAAGYEGVQAFPMRWHGRVIGAMNVFYATAHIDGSDGTVLGQAFADFATVVIVQSAEVPPELVTVRVHEALQARTAIEQAKGVLAYQQGIEMGVAYEALRRTAEADGVTLTTAARALLARAQRRPTR